MRRHPRYALRQQTNGGPAGGEVRSGEMVNAENGVAAALCTQPLAPVGLTPYDKDRQVATVLNNSDPPPIYSSGHRAANFQAPIKGSSASWPNLLPWLHH